MKHFVTRASISTVLGFVWIFFSLSAFADLFDDGYNAGKATCETCPPDRYEEGKNAGLAACPAPAPDRYQEGYDAKVCPSDRYQEGYDKGFAACSAPAPDRYQEGYDKGFAACPAPAPDRYQEGYDAGTAACPITPDRYQEGYDAGTAACPITPDRYEEGKEECRSNPAACGIFTNVTDATKKAISDYCSKDPSRCFDEFVPASNIDETYCDNKTENCLSFSKGLLYLSSVDVEYTNTLIAKDVQMDILTGRDRSVFLFHLKKEFKLSSDGINFLTKTTLKPKSKLTIIKTEDAQVKITITSITVVNDEGVTVVNDEGVKETTTVEIDCSNGCEAYYPNGTEVTLSVVVTEGVNVKWDECVPKESTTDYVVYSDPVTMTEDKTCTFSVE